MKKNTDHLLHLESEPRLEEEALYREDKSHLEFTWDGKREHDQAGTAAKSARGAWAEVRKKTQLSVLPNAS